jgi:3D (Asp-Asp-Asp) domain-containing protein
VKTREAIWFGAHKDGASHGTDATWSDLRRRVAKRRMARAAVEAGAACGILALTALTAILAKERFGVPLAHVEVRPIHSVIDVARPAPKPDPAPVSAYVSDANLVSPDVLNGPATGLVEPAPKADAPEVDAQDAFADQWGDVVFDAEVRWFNGRPARPARVIWMTVTAYSPDAASCGEFADGKTATLHSVTTNGHRLVAADPKLLPYGSMLTVPGYGREAIVPVLDCGGAIKGRRLDVLFPTHEQARAWGTRRIPVTVWEYTDGKGKDNPRQLR